MKANDRNELASAQCCFKPIAITAVWCDISIGTPVTIPDLMIQNPLHCAFQMTPRASKFYGEERHQLFWAGSWVSRGKTKISGTPNLNKCVIFISHTQFINVTVGPHNTRYLIMFPNHFTSEKY